MAPLSDLFPMADKESWSPLQNARSLYSPALPPSLQSDDVSAVRGSQTTALDFADRAAVQREFPLTFGLPLITLAASDGTSEPDKNQGPLRVGILFHGRQSPGGHNVITGVFDSLTKLNPGSTLLGFQDGMEGLIAQKPLELTSEVIDLYRNQGGFDMLGRSKDESMTAEAIESAKSACQALNLDGLLLIGGCASATNAAQLAETFAASKISTRVVAVPCTIDNDLKSPFVPVTAGFDTACRVYSELVSNICTDALSAEKYYFFIRLMGRRSSHLALECMLRTQANIVILGEEVLLSKLTLYDLTKKLCDAICQRSAEKGKHHGVVIFPEGLIEHIPEVHSLLEEVNGLIRDGVAAPGDIESRVSPWSRAVLEFLPPRIKDELLAHRDSDGSVRFSKIETEKLFMMLVEKEMERRTKAGLYKGKKFNGITYFFGYQARGSLPSNFDCDYATTLGHTAARLVAANANGYMAAVSGIQAGVDTWLPGGVPITALMTVNRWLTGQDAALKGRPAVNPAKVDIWGKAFKQLEENAATWLMEDLYRNPGPLQFEGPGASTLPVTLELESIDYFAKIQMLQDYLTQVKDLVRPGCSPDVLQTAVTSMASVVDVVSILTKHHSSLAS